MASDNINGGDQCSVTTLFCNSWVNKQGGPTLDVTILKEIYYITYLPNDISCTGNDITVGCNGFWIHSALLLLHSPRWISINFWLSMFSIVTEVIPLLPAVIIKFIPLGIALELITSGKSVIFQNIK